MASKRKSFLGKIFTGPKARDRARQRRLVAEALETRRVLSAATPYVDTITSQLVIVGSDGVEDVVVQASSPTSVTVRTISDGVAKSYSFSSTGVSSILFQGLGGDDFFYNSTDLPSVAYGGEGNDRLTGGSATDQLDGGPGDDKLNGAGGDDLITGGAGDDLLFGGDDDDEMDGGSGADRLDGGGGDDVLFGGEHADQLKGGDGRDILDGGSGDDVLLGENGTDLLIGDEGNDQLFGGDDDDSLYGGAGDDYIDAGAGDDSVDAGAGADRVIGGLGDDTVLGGIGNDQINGSAGDDFLDGGDGEDIISGDDGNDVIEGGAGADQLWGGAGRDQIFGGAGSDYLDGEGGDDGLDGGDDDDVLYGRAGNDVLKGRLGDDRLFGGAGADYLDGHEGDDQLFGEDGADNLLGGSGADELFGDAGNDKLRGGDGDDYLEGGDDNDILFGGEGNDRLQGGGGNDQAFGGAGDDNLSGSDGDDYLAGEAGDDIINGGTGRDRLHGGEGFDQLYGDADFDVIYGGAGNDYLSGGEGSDWLFGEGGDDRLYGGVGNDELFGGQGADNLYGDAGDDYLAGEGGDDNLEGDVGADRLIGGSGDDQLFGGADSDRIDGGVGDDYLEGGAGDDELVGRAGSDRLSGDAGNDVVSGGDGNDRLNGGDDDDILSGDEGADLVFGDAGDDTLWGGAGDDELFGDAGDDWLNGDAGEDYLNGGLGVDILMGGADDDLLWTFDGGDALVGDEGDDRLTATSGNNLLIGGEGADTLRGGSDEDLLIGGRTAYDNDSKALRRLLAIWAFPASYDVRVAAMTDAASADILMIRMTVFDDLTADSVSGGSGRDWFFLTGEAPVYDPNAAHHDGHGGTEAGHHDATLVVTVPPVLEGLELDSSLDALVDRTSDEVMSSVLPHSQARGALTQHLAVFDLVKYQDVTRYAVGSGDWSDPSTWSGGVVPRQGERVLVPIGTTVVVDSVNLPSVATVRVDGVLEFSTTTDSHLLVDTMVVTHGGSLRIGTLDAPIPSDIEARLTFTDTGEIDRTSDPFGLGRGLITHGNVQMHGAEKTTFVESVGSIPAGSSVISLLESPVGWKTGDKLVIPGSVGDGSQDEVRTIEAIIGDSVVVQPLVYSHGTGIAGLNVQIVNLTRNVVLDSEGVEAARRGHVMFMHNPDVDVRYVAFQSMGRTDKSIPINDPVVDADWNLVPGTGTNPRARYAVHFHRAGVTLEDGPAIVHGSVVDDSVGWGFVNHSSHVNVTDSAAYDVRGAGFVGEAGDEIGLFEHNIAVHSSGPDERVYAREVIGDFGHTGVGFWLQGPGIRVVDNIAAGSTSYGFVVYSKGLDEAGIGQREFLAENLQDPSLAGGERTVAVEKVPLVEFRGNEAYAAKTGLAVFNLLRSTSQGQTSELSGSTFWNNQTGVSLHYTENTTLDNFRIFNFDQPDAHTGVTVNAETSSINYVDLTIHGYTWGVEVARRGDSVIAGGDYQNQFNLVIASPTADGRTVDVRGPITFGASPGSGLRANVLMRFFATYPELGVDSAFYTNEVTLNYGPYSGQKAYFSQQLPTAIPFPTAEEGVPSQYVGLTSLQLAVLYGRPIAGELAPLDALAGLIDPLKV